MKKNKNLLNPVNHCDDSIAVGEGDKPTLLKGFSCISLLKKLTPHHTPHHTPHPNPLPQRGEGIESFTDSTSVIQGARETVKPAFTLAEVLITLGIIGIVAALTIPTLVTNIQKKQTVTKLQKAISVINQAYRMSYNDVGEATPQEAVEMGATAYFEKYWKPYLKTAHICTNRVDCGYSSNVPFYLKNGEKDTTSLTNPTTRTTFYTPDGYVYIVFIAYYNSTNALTSIWVDINGSKAPNKLGYDVFVLRRVVDPIKGGYVRPYGYEESTATINQICSGGGRGEYCAEKIRRDGWQIKDDYGWGK